MGIYKPEIGDTVRFWNDKDELWETGDVIAYGADHRIYFIQPNDEDLAECLVDYTDISPVSEQKTTGRMSALEFELDYWKNRAEVTHLQHVAANKRADDAENLVEELEDRNRILKSDLDELREKYRKDADPDLVRSHERKIANIRAELDRAWSKADNFEFKWRMTAEGKAATRKGSVKEVLAEMSAPKAVIDGAGSRWELDPVTDRYIFGTSIRSLGYIEDVYGIAERLY